jgi:hypothetical protein
VPRSLEVAGIRAALDRIATSGSSSTTPKPVTMGDPHTPVQAVTVAPNGQME